VRERVAFSLYVQHTGGAAMIFDRSE